MSVLEIIHNAIEILANLAKFAVLMALIVVIPRLSRRVRLPEAVGLSRSSNVVASWQKTLSYKCLITHCFVSVYRNR